jgi:hypothetical protein
LARLRQECGHEFVNKCEAMMRDLNESNELMKLYKR